MPVLKRNAWVGAEQRAPRTADLARTGTLKIFTTNMLPGYLRKNGVPYSSSASLTEYVNRLTGANGEAYIALTSMLEDARYLTQPFVRTYTFKQQPDASGWAPTECLPR